MAMQSYFIDMSTPQKSAFMELASRGVRVWQSRITESGVAIQIEPTELYQDGQSIHNCRLVFKVD